MKKISICSCLSFLLLTFFAFSVSAQTFHTIIFTDTQDESIGQAAQASHDNYSLDFLTTIETSIGTSYNSALPIDKKAYECNKTNLLSTLNNLTCTDKDIVVFIYIGHGSRGVNDWSNFPQMCFALPQGEMFRNGEDFYPLENVRDLIMKKNPHFCLVVGDCCNSVSPTLSTKPPVNYAFATEPDIIRKKGEENIKELFLSKSGSVILTASVKGQYGWCITKGASLGMFLEKNLNEVFQDIKDGKASYSNWEDLLSTVKNNTYLFSTKRELVDIVDGKPVRYTQTPYYEIKLSNDSVDRKPKGDVEAKDLRQALAQVADDRNLDDATRIRKSREVKAKYFEGNECLVKVVGKDRKTVILSTSIDKYLLRLSTETDLANLTILEQIKNDKGKVIFLKIHEIYVESEEE